MVDSRKLRRLYAREELGERGEQIVLGFKLVWERRNGKRARALANDL